MDKTNTCLLILILFSEYIYQNKQFWLDFNELIEGNAEFTLFVRAIKNNLLKRCIYQEMGIGGLVGKSE